MALTSAKQAELLKDQGNVYFRKERLAAAIDAYTEAITLCPMVPVYWTNRALCHRRRNDWTRLEEDCRKALELDKDSVKAYYMLGLALLQRKEYSEAVRHLEKALELGRGGNPASYMVEEIWQELSTAKYTEWQSKSVVRREKHKRIREVCESAVKGENVDDVNCDEALGIVGEVFDRAAEEDTPSEVPEYLCCKITMDVYRDPVITPSGVTYERCVLLDHLKRVGKFDPLSRAPLEAEQIVPNLAIKEAVQSYLAGHGWAYKPC